jgi:hypothetical protein
MFFCLVDSNRMEQRTNGVDKTIVAGEVADILMAFCFLREISRRILRVAITEIPKRFTVTNV